MEGGRGYIISFNHYFQYTSCSWSSFKLVCYFFPHSLQELLQSSRTLSLKLLDFIMEWQVHGLGIFLKFLGQSKGHLKNFVWSWLVRRKKITTGFQHPVNCIGPHLGTTVTQI